MLLLESLNATFAAPFAAADDDEAVTIVPLVERGSEAAAPLEEDMEDNGSRETRDAICSDTSFTAFKKRFVED
jgi:hypothetical protein